MTNEERVLRMIQFVRGQAVLRSDDGPDTNAAKSVVAPYLNAALIAECGFLETKADVVDMVRELGRPFRELRAGYFIGSDGHMVGNN